MHLHLREGDMLKLVAPLTSKKISGALIMKNLLPITTKEALLSYKKIITVKLYPCGVTTNFQTN